MPNPTLNRRYQKLIDQLDHVHPDTREMFLYLFAMVAAEQGIISVERTQDERGRQVVVMLDPKKKQEFKVAYPEGLDPTFARVAVAEMERLLSDDSVGTSMDSTLFRQLYENHPCRSCSYHEDKHWQICAECHFAGYPINFERPSRQ
ncbi:MAG TPA: hypothetical protein VHS28_02335 [Chloroflexota bacterium]|nr:hypothetical protein [Chloroflexota bacterium]